MTVLSKVMKAAIAMMGLLHEPRVLPYSSTSWDENSTLLSEKEVPLPNITKAPKRKNNKPIKAAERYPTLKSTKASCMEGGCLECKAFSFVQMDASRGMGIQPMKAIMKPILAVDQMEGAGNDETGADLCTPMAKITAAKAATVRILIMTFMLLSSPGYLPISSNAMQVPRITRLHIKGDQPKLNKRSASPAVTIVTAACIINMLPIVRAT